MLLMDIEENWYLMVILKVRPIFPSLYEDERVWEGDLKFDLLAAIILQLLLNGIGVSCMNWKSKIQFCKWKNQFFWEITQ